MFSNSAAVLHIVQIMLLFLSLHGFRSNLLGFAFILICYLSSYVMQELKRLAQAQSSVPNGDIKVKSEL